MIRRMHGVAAAGTALAGLLLLVAWAVLGGAGREAVRQSMTAVTHTPAIVERLVPSLPATPPTALPWTPRPTAAVPARQSDRSPTSSWSAAEPASPQVADQEAHPVDTVTARQGEQTRTVAETEATLTPPSEVEPEIQPSVSAPPNERYRFGAVNRLGGLESYDTAVLNAGWYLSGPGGTVPPGAGVVYLVWVDGDKYAPLADTLAALVAASPGAVWQIGNEPDVIWQSNSTPEEYARVYHELYALIKEADPTARVAAGSVSQPTPLRLQYLDLVLAAYQSMFGSPMPVDIWSVHNSILREERGSWGVDIPPGITADVGRLYEINDNDRLDLFRQQLIDFRTWMRANGYQDRPLYLTEFSILMPAEYGFPAERVAAFMTGAFDYMLSAVDENLGCPADGYRLVQRWAWYSVADTSEAGHYPTGNLYDPVTKVMTTVGWSYAQYTATH